MPQSANSLKHAQLREKIVLWCLPALAVLGLLLAKWIYATWVMPWMPPCLLRTLTGLLCPSCGMTHSVFALCRGDVLGALRANALIPAAVLLALLWYVERMLRAYGHSKQIIPRNRIVWIAVLGMVVVYWVLRNVIR